MPVPSHPGDFERESASWSEEVRLEKLQRLQKSQRFFNAITTEEKKEWIRVLLKRNPKAPSPDFKGFWISLFLDESPARKVTNRFTIRFPQFTNEYKIIAHIILRLISRDKSLHLYVFEEIFDNAALHGDAVRSLSHLHLYILSQLHESGVLLEKKDESEMLRSAFTNPFFNQIDAYSLLFYTDQGFDNPGAGWFLGYQLQALEDSLSSRRTDFNQSLMLRLSMTEIIGSPNREYSPRIVAMGDKIFAQIEAASQSLIKSRQSSLEEKRILGDTLVNLFQAWSMVFVGERAFLNKYEADKVGIEDYRFKEILHQIDDLPEMETEQYRRILKSISSAANKRWHGHSTEHMVKNLLNITNELDNGYGDVIDQTPKWITKLLNHYKSLLDTEGELSASTHPMTDTHRHFGAEAGLIERYGDYPVLLP